MWYKVEDKLPKPFQVVLTFTKQGRYKINNITQNKQWLGMHTTEDEVVAWMELPEAPEGYEPKVTTSLGRTRYLTKKY